MLDDCPICLQDISDDLFTTVCNHKYHRECMRIFLTATHERNAEYKCPLCRQHNPIGDLIVYNEGDELHPIGSIRNVFFKNSYTNVEVVKIGYAALSNTKYYACKIEKYSNAIHLLYDGINCRFENL